MVQIRPKKGDKVKILTSNHSQISTEDVGVVDSPYKGGWGIAFTKKWPAMVSHEKPVSDDLHQLRDYQGPLLAL